jgi:hypothetical protein
VEILLCGNVFPFFASCLEMVGKTIVSVGLRGRFPDLRAIILVFV